MKGTVEQAARGQAKVNVANINGMPERVSLRNTQEDDNSSIATVSAEERSGGGGASAPTVQAKVKAQDAPAAANDGDHGGVDGHADAAGADVNAKVKPGVAADADADADAETLSDGSEEEEEEEDEGSDLEDDRCVAWCGVVWCGDHCQRTK